MVNVDKFIDFLFFVPFANDDMNAGFPKYDMDLIRCLQFEYFLSRVGFKCSRFTSMNKWYVKVAQRSKDWFEKKHYVF